MVRTKVSKPSRNGHSSNGQSLYGFSDPIANNRLADLANNLMSFRTELVQQLMDPRRDIELECGHPPLEGDINIELYQQLYEREGIATRVVEIMAKEAWQVPPDIYEEEDPNKITDFEEDWDSLAAQVRGEKSWYKQEEGNPVWNALRKAHVHSRIGRFGLLLIGINDGKDLREPAEGVEGERDDKKLEKEKQGEVTGNYVDYPGSEAPDSEYDNYTLAPATKSKKGKKRKIIYLRSFSEANASVLNWEKDIHNKRFGLPTEYQVTINDPRNFSGMGPPLSTAVVHWTRVIHIPAELDYPPMRPVLGYLLNLHKLYGGSAEMYWRGAFPGYSIETHPQLGGDVAVDQEGIRDQMELYMNKLQRYLVLMGMSMKSQAPQVVDPTPQINTQIDAIAMTIGVPKRKLMGSERGELASSEDDQGWNDRLAEYNNNYTNSAIVIPFVDRLIAMGILSEPKEEWCSEWPDLNALTNSEKADLLVKRTGAYMQYVQGGLEALIPPLDFMTRFDSMDEEEANTVIENAMEAEEEKLEESQLKLEEAAANPDQPLLNPPDKIGENPFAPKEEEEEVVAGKKAKAEVAK